MQRKEAIHRAGIEASAIIRQEAGEIHRDHVLELFDGPDYDAASYTDLRSVVGQVAKEQGRKIKRDGTIAAIPQSLNEAREAMARAERDLRAAQRRLEIARDRVDALRESEV